MKKQIFFTYRLFIIITYLYGILADVRIKPDVSEITLTSEADYELICAGNVPVTWNFTYYNQNPPSEKISSIDIVSKKLEKMFSEYNNNYQYSSVLTLSKVNYLVTGNYYCSPSSSDVKLDEQNSKNIYIYVQHKTHLLAVPENLNKLYQDEFGEVIIPCRPTAPDVNVTLKKDNQVISDYLYYDEKRGYFLNSFLFQVSYNYSCEANKKNVYDSRNFTIYINTNATQININADSDTITKGQNLILNCSVNTFFDNSLILNWKLSANQKLRAQHRNVSKDSTRVGVIRYDKTLFLQNISTKDDGVYVCICKVKTHSERIINATFDLKAVESGTYLHLDIIDGESKIIRPVGFKSVQWMIKISAYPIANHKWIDEYGEEVTQREDKNDKIYLKRNETLSKFIIKNLELSDSMVYKLIANNGFQEKQISVTLSVKGKPSTNIKSEDVVETYEVGKTYNFKCITSGNPLPKIEWAFKNCSEYRECESKTQTPIFKFINNIIYFKSSKLEIIAAIELNVTEIGKLICKTSNELGNSIAEHEILATDVTNNFDVKGPHNIDAGETITIECSVSKYEYINDIQWYHRAVNQKDIVMNYYPDFSYIKNYTDENLIITRNETKFSYRSYLTIRNITTNYSGTFDCFANKREQLAYYVSLLPKSHKLTVVEPSGPVFYNSSNLNSKIEIGEPVQWWCYAHGIPSPTIFWYKDNQSLRFDKYDKRLLLQDNNQTLLITSTTLGDSGSYECRVSNKKGSVISTNILIVTDERRYRERMYFTVFYSVTAILIGVLMMVCVMYSKRNRKFKKELALATFNFENGAIESWNPDLTIEEQGELLPYNREWEFPTNRLKLGKKLGSGAFGVVYKAEAIGILDKNTITTVAVKTVKPSTDTFYKNSLASELKIMVHLGKHLNVINLLGACTGNICKNLMVIVEYCPYGNIHQYILKRRYRFVDQITPDDSLDYEIKTMAKYFINLNYEMVSNGIVQSKERNDNGTQSSCDSNLCAEEEPQRHSRCHGDLENDVDMPLCTHDLISWAFQVSRGMAYLASRRILHGDLAARNILLADENVVKICDFGLAKNMHKSDNYKKKSNKDLLPVKWMAIESLRDRVFSTQSDVWSFGIVLWEMFSLSVTPYPSIQSVSDLYINLVEGYRMERPIYSNSEIYNIMLDCWKIDPSSRPSFNDLADRFGSLLGRSITSHYINLNEEFVMMNTKGSLSKDYFSLVNSPTYVNCLSTSENNSNPSRENEDDIALKPIFNKS